MEKDKTNLGDVCFNLKVNGVDEISEKLSRLKELLVEVKDLAGLVFKLEV